MDTQQIDFTKLRKQGWYGTDASLGISLLEYGLLCREQGNDTYQFLFVVSWQDFEQPKYFDVGTFTEQEVNELLFNESWIDTDGVLSFVGLNAKQWKETDIISKVYDLLSYYGYQNIFGDSYHPMNTEDLINWIESY